MEALPLPCFKLLGKIMMSAPVQPGDQPRLELQSGGDPWTTIHRQGAEKPAGMKRVNGKRVECPLPVTRIRRLLDQACKEHDPTPISSRTLSTSDLKNGLTIPRDKTLHRFLSDPEKKLLQDEQIQRLQVVVVDPLMVVRVLSLAAPPQSLSYVLNGATWTDLVHSNRLAAGDTLQVWAVRMSDASLGFLLFNLF